MIWSAGALLVRIKPINVSPLRATALLLVALPTAVAIPRSIDRTLLESLSWSAQIPGDIIVAASFGLLLLAIKDSKSAELPTGLTKLNSLSKKLSDFSYTLYVTHSPLLHFANELYVERFGADRHHPLGPKIYVSILLILAIYVWAYFLYCLGEKHTVKLKKYFQSK
jgi:peptidoglycan/LPS O-acetylase OafA/YrhL